MWYGVTNDGTLQIAIDRIPSTTMAVEQKYQANPGLASVFGDTINDEDNAYEESALKDRYIEE